MKIENKREYSVSGKWGKSVRKNLHLKILYS